MKQVYSITYNCPKGYMKWTHRAMVLAILSLIVGIVLTAYSLSKDYPKNVELLYPGVGLMVFFLIAMIISLGNAYSRGCYKTAAAIWFLLPDFF